MAGDITMARYYENLASVFEPLAIKYRHILYVPGNHEYYKSSPKRRASAMASSASAHSRAARGAFSSRAAAGQ